MHLVAVDVLFLAGEDDDTLQVAFFEDVVDDLQFLGIIADVGTLADLLCRFGDSNLHLHRVVEQGDSQFTDLRRHRGREHNTLTRLRQLLHNLHDVVDESHIEHPVCLVEHEETATGEIEVSYFQMTEQPSGCGDEHIGTKTHATQFLFIASSVVATIDSHRRHTVEIIAEALHGLVYLLGKFTGGGHNDAVDGILGIVAVI